ncbi:CdaR family protein [Aquimarina longa]|uniref:CdaR family protein n=1 Tax=Aquimarina longa TaxID=1080221 RepID=UPI0007838CBD|nr:YbbR-like domain-containing protein [Aquimarina longa]
MPYRKKTRLFIKRSTVKTFLFFLLFTSLLWLFIQFSKNYTEEVEVAIQYVNIPKDKIFSERSDQTVRMVLNGNGFRLMNYNWTKPVLKLNVEDAYISNDDQYHFYIDKESVLFKNNLDFKGRVLSIQRDTLILRLYHNLKKKIPVKIVKDIQYAIGYGSDRGVVISPDSVVISGPSEHIDTIKSVYTERLSLEGLNVDYTSPLAIDGHKVLSTMTIVPPAVEASILVSKFTEGSQKIPVTLKNVPEGIEVKIFPKEISVVYRVGLDKYNGISPRDFIVAADYAKVSEESSFLTLELVTKPKSIHDVRLQVKQIQFVVLK